VRIRSGILAALSLAAAARHAAAPAHAAPPAGAVEAITGEVVSARGRFADRGRLIVTDVVLRADDGAEVALVQLGGRAGGLGQRTLPGPALLEAGLRVTVSVRPGQDAGGRPVRVVEGVQLDPAGPLPFVRTGPTAAGNYLYWRSGCIFLTFDAAGTSHLPGDQEFEVMEQVLATWNDAFGACSYLDLRVAGVIASTDRTRLIGHDRVNRVVFRDDVWCRPATDDLPMICLPRGAAGLTTVTYVDDASSARDGEIVDADVELNGEMFAISVDGQTLGEESCLADLANTFTHEVGHVMGLDHTCRAPGDPPRLDHRGDEVPLCSQTTDPEIVEATMYNFTECGDTDKASPESDDIAAICSIYPRDRDPRRCEPVEDLSAGCCAVAGGGDGDGAAAALLALLTALGSTAATRRRRRSG
jgi:hypothetical protein